MIKYIAKCPCGWRKESNVPNYIEQEACKHAILRMHIETVIEIKGECYSIPIFIN